MNERIRELAEQLGPVATIGNWGRVEWSDNVYPQLGDRMYAAIDLEKFAELILIEVTDILSTYRGKMVFEDGAEYNHEHPIIAIRKHFGIES